MFLSAAATVFVAQHVVTNTPADTNAIISLANWLAVSNLTG